MKNSSWEECLDHSILKWSGNLQEVLDQYKPHFVRRTLGEDCALCQKSSVLVNQKRKGTSTCSVCILYKFMKGNCDGFNIKHKDFNEILKKYELDHSRSPYAAALTNPQGMVNLLTACKSALEKGEIE